MVGGMARMAGTERSPRPQQDALEAFSAPDGGWNGANGTLCRTLMELLEESQPTAVVTVMAPGHDREPQV